jgi:hypothetical protein
MSKKAEIKSIFDLPIKTSRKIKNKNQAFIYPDRLVCHPDLKEKLEQAMRGVKATQIMGGTP